MAAESSRGLVIVPAYVDSRKTADTLQIVVASVARLVSADAVVILQANNKSRFIDCVRSTSRGGLRVLKYHRKLGKWPAVAEGIRACGSNAGWIAVFDADGSYDCADLIDASRLVWEGASHVVGRRSRPVLRAADQSSGNTRVYIEAYLNTLLLLSLGPDALHRYAGFDIQCGFQAFSNARAHEMLRGRLPFFGGELLEFERSVRAGDAVRSCDVQILGNPPSCHSVAEIIDSILSIRSFRSIATSLYQHALVVSERMYPEWIDDPFQFRQEISELLLSRLAEMRRRRASTLKCANDCG